tara:strand:+ start:79 stop:282 length:204 start_codon:yes stop_codon:yes gene_type:complete
MIIIPIDIPNMDAKESLNKTDLLAKCKSMLGENLFLEFEYFNGMIDDKEYSDIRPLNYDMKHKRGVK